MSASQNLYALGGSEVAVALQLADTDLVVIHRHVAVLVTLVHLADGMFAIAKRKKVYVLRLVACRDKSL